MNDSITAQMIEWVFPLVTDEGNAQANAAFPQIDSSQNKMSNQDITETLEAKELVFMKKENENLRDEIERTKQHFEQQIEIMMNLFSKLKNPVTLIDEEIIELIQDIIKKISKKIIQKEIAADPSLLVNMIDGLKSLIDEKHGFLSIHMSKEDFDRLEVAKTHLSGIACVEPNLEVGDIVVKSHFAEIRAVLNERIDQLTRVEHD